MTKSKIFLIFSLSFIFGIFLVSYISLNASWTYIAGALSIIIITINYKNKNALVTGLALLFCLLGVWRTQVEINRIPVVSPNKILSEEKTTVVKNPEKKEGYQNVVVKTVTDGKILLRSGINEDIAYGDEIVLTCVLKTPENRSLKFDYQMYLAKERINYLCHNAKYFKTGNNSASSFYGAILKIGKILEKNINEVIPQPQAALANGLLLGGSDRMGKDLREKFSQTGMTHIVAVSGYNVIIIAEYLMLLGISLGLWRRQSFWLAVTGIVFFVIMIGYPSSAVRAGVMGTLLLWAMKNGRLANSWNAIIFAAAIMLLFNPLLLRWDVGFQLSFLATIGIVSLSPVWENYFLSKKRSLGILEIIFLTVSAQIFVIPVILSSFGYFSPISLIANLLILPIVPVSMLFSFLTALVGIFSYSFSLPFAWLAYLPLKYEIEIVEILSQITWASINTGKFNWLLALLWYGTLSAIIIILRRKINAKKKADLWSSGGPLHA